MAKSMGEMKRNFAISLDGRRREKRMPVATLAQAAMIEVSRLGDILAGKTLADMDELSRISKTIEAHKVGPGIVARAMRAIGICCALLVLSSSCLSAEITKSVDELLDGIDALFVENRVERKDDEIEIYRQTEDRYACMWVRLSEDTRTIYSITLMICTSSAAGFNERNALVFAKFIANLDPSDPKLFRKFIEAFEGIQKKRWGSGKYFLRIGTMRAWVSLIVHEPGLESWIIKIE